MSDRAAYGRRAGVFVAIVVVMLLGAAVAPALLGANPGVPDGPDHPAWQPADLAPDRLEASGTPAPDVNGVGTVVFDGTHNNRFEPEDVAALTGAIVRAGGDVRFTAPGASMSSALAGADVLVIVDPGVPYGSTEIDAIESFVRDGGRVVIFAEPNRQTVQASGFALAVATERSRVTALGSAFGIGFDTEYLYDMRANDGGFKNVVAGSTPRGGDLTEGVEQVAMYTATSLSVDRGSVVLRTADSAERGGERSENGYPVAVLTARGKVLAFGDASFIGEETAAVGDNDVLIGRIVEFMAGADVSPDTNATD